MAIYLADEKGIRLVVYQPIVHLEEDSFMPNTLLEKVEFFKTWPIVKDYLCST